ncbi:MAG: hypothetical protein GY926_12655 [bacterium]|nr:hypothetical protein [bacterium]
MRSVLEEVRNSGTIGGGAGGIAAGAVVGPVSPAVPVGGRIVVWGSASSVGEHEEARIMMTISGTARRD